MKPQLVKLCKEAKLHYLANNYDAFLEGFKRHKDITSAVIEQLLLSEATERQKRSQERRLNGAKIGRFKPFHDFDWEWPKKINRTDVERALSLQFIEDKENLIIIGPQGAGKTMLAKNIAYRTALSGKTSLVVSASELVLDLTSAKTAGVFRSRIRRYLRPSVLIIDEIGYLSYDNKAADLLFDVVTKRYEKAPVVMTTNLPFQDWGKIFPGASCVVAMIDRLTHHSDIISIDADSYRLKEAKDKQKEKHKSTQKGKNQ